VSDEKNLTIVEQKEVEFYGDVLVAVRTDNDNVYVPVRPICDLLGVQWSAQSKRIKRDPVLSQESVSVSIMDTQGGQPQHRAMVCLPLDFLSGFLFGINASRVKIELRETVTRYQRECYRVMAEAFEEGRLTSDPAFDQLLEDADSATVQAYQIALAVVKLARNQILLQGRVVDNSRRIEQIEATLGDPGRHITPDQASQISQAIKAVAMKLSEGSGRNEYGGVYGELYRKFGITSYKLLPAQRFQEAMDWLSEWYQSITDDEVPF